MKLSIISYAFNQMMKEGLVDVFGYMETCKYRFRLPAADIWQGMLTSLDAGYIAKVKAGLCERELDLACLAVDGAHIWEDDAQAREKNYQNALAHMAAGETLGAKTIRIDAGSRADTWTAQEFDHIVKRYKEYAQRAYDNGYLIGPENHWGPERNPSEFKRLIDAVDSPAFGVLLHFGRWSGDADIAAADEMFLPWAMHTHITPATPDDRMAELMAMLRDSGYKGYYGVEMVSMSYYVLAAHIAKVAGILDSWR